MLKVEGPYRSLVPRLPDLFNVLREKAGFSACNIEKLGIGPGNEATISHAEHAQKFLTTPTFHSNYTPIFATTRQAGKDILAVE